MTQPLTHDKPAPTAEDRVVHAFCGRCQPFRRGRPAVTLCGVEKTHTGADLGLPRCVVCTDLFNKPCERCGT